MQAPSRSREPGSCKDASTRHVSASGAFPTSMTVTTAALPTVGIAVTNKTVAQ
jgi:hypothetical protein